jgi:hypothetical protein
MEFSRGPVPVEKSIIYRELGPAELIVMVEGLEASRVALSKKEVWLS